MTMLSIIKDEVEYLRVLYYWAPILIWALGDALVGGGAII